MLITGLFALTLSAGILPVNSQVAYANGNGSPEACSSNPNVNPNASNVKGSQEGSEDLVTTDAGTGNIVTGVCIKSGNNSFDGEKHSGVLGNGIHDNGCYQVSGVGTQVATVTRIGDGNDCQGISHIDVLFSKPNVNGGIGGGNGGGSQPVQPTGGIGGGSTTAPAPTSAPAAAAPQVDTPATAVKAGGTGSIVASLVGLSGAAATFGYGVMRFRKFNS